jgi:hypothetical protein
MTPTPAPRKGGPPGAKPAAGKRPRAPFEIDRVIAMRVGFVVVVGLFLYMILRISIIAFGGGAAREVKHLEHAVEGKTTPAASTKPEGAAPP